MNSFARRTAVGPERADRSAPDLETTTAAGLDGPAPGLMGQGSVDVAGLGGGSWQCGYTWSNGYTWSAPIAAGRHPGGWAGDPSHAALVDWTGGYSHGPHPRP